MADLHAHVGRGGFERARIMPPSDITLTRNIPAETVKIGRSLVASTGDPLFFDDFEYVVNRSDTNAVALFQAAGWQDGKLENGDVSTGANGWMYTVTSIPGYGGAFPGGGSRVLCMELAPADIGGFVQTDAWLQLTSLPADIWIQYWCYPQNHSASGQLSQHYGPSNNKWFYFAREGYPSHNHGLMILTTQYTHKPLDQAPWSGISEPSPNGEHVYMFSSFDGGSNIFHDDWQAGDKAGQSTISEYMVPNRWTLVKWHIQTAGTTGNQVELWLRPFNGSSTKVMDYTDGVAGFIFTQPVGGGHLAMRWPTVIDEYPYWMYIDDFTLAETEADLPVYGDGS